jgi:hypothetical protein
MISERTLRRWRKDALKGIELWHTLNMPKSDLPETEQSFKERNERILRLTAELMDLHLMRKG